MVDDENDFVELISFNLELSGYEVLKAYNGAQGLTLARNELPDLILLDVMMPGIDGFSVCEILRRETPTARIPIVMCSALGGEMARMNGLGAGADDYLSKGSRIQALVERVRTVLTLRAHSKSNGTGSTQVWNVRSSASSAH